MGTPPYLSHGLSTPTTQVAMCPEPDQSGLQTQVEENIQLPGDHVRRDGIFTYLGFQLANEAKHGVRYFS